MRSEALIFFSIALALASSQVHPSDTCQLRKYADLPVTMEGTRPIIGGSVNGVDAHFVASSATSYSVLLRDSAAKFNLKLYDYPWPNALRGVGGNESPKMATAKDFSLVGFGDSVIHGVDFMVGGNAFVSAPGVDGVIGENVLGNADAEYDLAHGSIRLFRVKGCGDASLAYWHGTAPVAVLHIDGRQSTPSRPIGRATLNGSPIGVVFSSGASRSMLTLEAATRAGFKRDAANVVGGGPLRGLGPKQTETWIARFDLLDLGGEQVKQALLLVGDFQLGGRADMTLGADFFLSHRIYVANSQQKIYVTYNGGRVFDLSVAPSTEAGAPVGADQPGATVVPAGNADEPTDAPGLRRRGAASAGRGDLRSAVADLDEAVKRDPADAENYYQRGLIRGQDHQSVLALSDFDQALKINANHVEALMARGTLRLGSKDKEGADTDFSAAIGVSPTDAGLAVRVAQTYSSQGYFAEAIERLDPWIAAHRWDDRRANALNSRCWARAMLGQGLDLALADCNAAVANSPRISYFLDSRALVRLRLGDIDHSISDYEASLKLQPAKAWSLYGLGLAELKKGRPEKGNQHLQAAIAINPGIAAEFKKLGLAP